MPLPNPVRIATVVCLTFVLSSPTITGSVHAAAAETTVPQNDADAFVKLPLTPASIALLALSITSPVVQDRLATALADPRADVRLVAARVAFAGRVAPLRPALLDALAGEDDPRAGVEEARAAIALGEADDEPRIRAAARRLGDPVIRAYLTTLARIRPADAIARAPELLPLTRPGIIGGVLAIAIVRQPSLADAIFGQLATGTGDASAALIKAFLDALDFEAASTVSIVARALRTSSAEVRVAPVWRVAHLYALGQPFNPALLSMFKATPGDPVSQEAFARAILGRVMKQATPSTDWTDALREHHWYIPRTMQAWLTRSEFAALASDSDREQPKKWGSQRFVHASAGGARLRSLPALQAGLMKDILALAGCESGNALRRTGAAIKYGQSGRAENVAVAADHPSPACDVAMRAAAALTIAPDHELQPERLVDVLYFEIDPVLPTCASAAPLGAIAWSLDKDTFTRSPGVRHEQKPDYTPESRARGVEGAAWVRAIISPQGCVSDVEIIRRLDPALDLQALRAVSRWQFDPAQREGQAVASGVIVEVSFTIR